jgi:hypothetical protein
VSLLFVLFAINVNVPAPDCTKLPVPLTTPPKVTASLRSKANVPLSVTFPVMLPVAPPLPSCSVPALMVVPPE